MAVAVGVQSAQGVVNATIRDLTGALNAATHGLVLGDPESGLGESGIEVEFARALTEKARLANFTTQPSNFLRQQIETLTIAWQLKGNGNVLSGAPADTEFALDPGIDALLQGLSLASANWGGGVGKIYTPAPLVYLTVALWIGNRTADGFALKWVFQDCIAAGEMEFTPAGLGVATADLAVGSVVPSFGGIEVASPTFDYQEQASQSAPVVQGVAHAWGATRGFRSMTVGFENDIDDLEDSNAPTGLTPRITGRRITASGEMYADSVDLDFEATELVRATAPTSPLSFTVGTAGVPAGRALAYRPRLTTPELRSLGPQRAGDVLSWETELMAVSGIANGEFELIFL